jgi:hypothetical protein
MREKKDGFSLFTRQFHCEAAKQIESFESLMGPFQHSREDVIAVFNLYVHCVYLYGQRRGIDSVSPLRPASANVSSATCTATGSQPAPATDGIVPDEYLPETDCGLLSLGGGTIGEIWKVSKRRKWRKDLSSKQVGIEYVTNCVRCPMCVRAYAVRCVCGGGGEQPGS